MNAVRLLLGTSRPSCPRGQMIPAGLYKAPEAAGQLANPILLATVDRVRRDQFPPNSNGYGARKDEIGRILLIHSSGGHQRNLRKHSMEGSNVGFTANLGAGHDLDKIGICFPCGNNFRRGQRPRDDHHILFGGELDHGRTQPITRQKLRSGVETQLRNRRIRHSSRTDNNSGNAFDQLRDDLDTLGHGQWDFDDDNPSLGDRLSGKKGVLLRVDANRSDNAGFLKPASHLESLHLVVSFGACPRPS